MSNFTLNTVLDSIKSNTSIKLKVIYKNYFNDVKVYFLSVDKELQKPLR